MSATLLLLLGGPLALLFTQLFPAPFSVTPIQWTLAGILFWMILWWGSEVVPMAATSLLPLVLFPVFDILPEAQVAGFYAHPLTFLFMGGFFIAVALEKSGLHHRLALTILKWTGHSALTALAGIMAMTAALSMWISNTATALMMVPIAAALIDQMVDQKMPAEQILHFAKPLLLSVAYCASIGGLGTLVGTPTNLYFANFYEQTYGLRITMLGWMKVGIPFMLIMLLLTFVYLVIHYQLWSMRFPNLSHRFKDAHAQLPALSISQWAVLTIFAGTCIAWMFSLPLQRWTGLPLSDTVIALVAAVLLMTIPASLSEKRFLLKWEDATQIPWGILLLFGAGLAITAAFASTGLYAQMAGWFTRLSGIHSVLMLAAFASLALLVTELVSNSTAIATLLPVAAAIAAGTGVPALLLMFPLTLIVSGGFMMPTGTPPNAIVLGTGKLHISDMFRVGIVLNILMLVAVVVVGMMWQAR